MEGLQLTKQEDSYCHTIHQSFYQETIDSGRFDIIKGESPDTDNRAFMCWCDSFIDADKLYRSLQINNKVCLLHDMDFDWVVWFRK